MADYLNRLQHMVRELKANPLVEVRKCVLKPATDANRRAVDALIARHGPLAAFVAPFYREVKSFALEWHAKLDDAEGDDSWGGFVHILPMRKMFGDMREVLWFDWQEPDHVFHSLRPFDYFIPEACVVVMPYKGQPALAFHHCGEDLGTMGVDLDGWFDLLCESRGWFYWASTLSPVAVGSELAQRLPRVFADVNKKHFKRVKGTREIAC